MLRPDNCVLVNLNPFILVDKSPVLGGTILGNFHLKLISIISSLSLYYSVYYLN